VEVDVDMVEVEVVLEVEVEMKMGSRSRSRWRWRCTAKHSATGVHGMHAHLYVTRHVAGARTTGSPE
jgi:hypothetical protein